MDQYPHQTPPPPVSQPGYPSLPSATPQQPGYPPPGYAQQSGYPVRPLLKSRVSLWGILLLVVLLMGVGGYLYIHGQSSPTATVNQWCDGIKKMDAHEEYATYSKSFLSQGNRQNEQEMQQTYNEGEKSHYLTITTCDVTNVQQNDSTAIATITSTRIVNGETKDSIDTISLIQENGQWKINKFTE